MIVWIYILSFFGALGLSYVSIFLVSKIFQRYKIVDKPQKYGKKRKPIPYSIGIIFICVFLIVSFFTIDFSYKLGLIWVFGVAVTLMGFTDDLLNLSPKTRLIIQIFIGATIGITSIKIGYISNIFGGVINLETLSFFIAQKEIFLVPLIFTIFWYVFVFNALNWTDGIQGNTSGLSIISFFVIFLLGLKLFMTDSYQGGRENALFIMHVSVIILGVLIPFFYYDIREKLLMGDSGTMFLGFMLATVAIISGGKIATFLAVFGIYAVDAVYVILRRISKGKNPMKGDFTHLHHRLLKVGFQKDHILILVFSLSFIFGCTSLFLETGGKIVVFCIITLFVLSLSYVGERVKKISFKK